MRSLFRIGEATEAPAERAPEPVTRKRRRDAGQTQITVRDLMVLPWVGEQYAVRLDQLQLLLARVADPTAELEEGTGLDAARHVLGRWEKLGLAASRKVYADQPRWLWLTSKGLSRLERRYRFKTPAENRFAHYHAVNQVRLYLEGARYAPEARWRPERDLIPEGARLGETHYVDGEVETQGRTVGIEVERTPKRPDDLLVILRGLTAAYESVWYFALSEAKPGVERQIARLPEPSRKRITVFRLEPLL